MFCNRARKIARFFDNMSLKRVSTFEYFEWAQFPRRMPGGCATAVSQRQGPLLSGPKAFAKGQTSAGIVSPIAFRTGAPR